MNFTAATKLREVYKSPDNGEKSIKKLKLDLSPNQNSRVEGSKNGLDSNTSEVLDSVVLNEEKIAKQKSEETSNDGLLVSDIEEEFSDTGASSLSPDSRQNFCLFCYKPQKKLARHLFSSHKKEAKVKEILKLPKLSLPRKKLLEKLRVYGNYLHNRKVLDTGKGELIPAVRPKGKIDQNEYVTCEICLGLYMKKHLEKHQKACSETSDMDWSHYDQEKDSANVEEELKTDENDAELENAELNGESDDTLDSCLGEQTEQGDFEIHTGNHFLSGFSELGTFRSLYEEAQLNLLTSMAKGDGIRNYCPFCSAPSVKLNRHILSKHSSEPKVQELLQLSKFSAERKRIYDELRLQGNLQYNIRLLAGSQQNEIPLCINSSRASAENNSAICPTCTQSIKTNIFAAHFSKCKFRNPQTTEATQASTSNRIHSSSALKTRRTASESSPMKNYKVPKIEDKECVKKYTIHTGRRQRYSGKINYCMFCGQTCTKVVRHFSSRHKDEKEVIRLLSLPSRSEERLLLASSLRQKGNAKHEAEVSKPPKSKTSSMRKRKETKEKEGEKEEKSKVIACKYCQVVFKRQLLNKHIQKCTSNESKQKSSKDLLQQWSLNLLPISNEVKALFKVEVLDTMIKDDLAMLIHDDPLIRDYGEHLFAPGRKKSTLLSIKRKLRLLAKFLEEMMERNNDVECLRNILRPDYFREILACAKKMYKYCSKTESFNSAYNSYYVAQGLSFCAQFLQKNLISNSESDQEVQAFLKLFEAEFYPKVSRKPTKQEPTCEYVPSDDPYIQMAEDVIQMYEYMDTVSLKVRTKLKIDPTPEDFLTHMKSVLSSLAIINSSLKRDIETLTVDDYKTLSDPSKTKSLEKIDVILNKEFYKLSKEDNRGKTITIYFSKDHKHALDLSLELREKIGVNEDNHYLFPRVYHSSLFCLKASICLKEYVKLAELKNQELFLSSEQEKMTSRLFYVLHMSSNAQKDVQNFLNIHGTIQCFQFDAKSGNLLAYLARTIENSVKSKVEEGAIPTAVEEESKEPPPTLEMNSEKIPAKSDK